VLWTPETPLGAPVYAPSVVPLTLFFPEPGLYTIVLRLDGEEQASYAVHAAFAA
jgi:hypothetical protein